MYHEDPEPGADKLPVAKEGTLSPFPLGLYLYLSIYLSIIFPSILASIHPSMHPAIPDFSAITSTRFLRVSAFTRLQLEQTETPWCPWIQFQMPSLGQVAIPITSYIHGVGQARLLARTLIGADRIVLRLEMVRMGKHTSGIHYLSVPEDWQSEEFLGFWEAKEPLKKAKCLLRSERRKKVGWREGQIRNVGLTDTDYYT